MKRLSNQYRSGDLNAMVVSICHSHVIYLAVPDHAVQAVDLVNPYTPLIDVYERGVIPDFVTWRFTNLHGEDLGPLPDPIIS
jgi:hypothetical protein